MGDLLEEIPQQKEIVLIPFFFSDLKQTKTRPAIIISKNIYNETNQDIIVMPLTTNLRKLEYNIQIDNEDLEKGFLIKQSEIRVDKIYSINQNLIIMKIGIVNQEIIEKLIKNLITLLTN